MPAADWRPACSRSEIGWVAETFDNNGLGAEQLPASKPPRASAATGAAGRKVVHLACHGLVDQAYGNLFGALAMTPGPNIDRRGRRGLLTLAEIYGLNLKGCELTILSACDTNVRPEQRGEGVWALSRGFLVAGSRRVVASNWLVDDEAAASLVGYFCGGIRQGRKWRTPDYAQACTRPNAGSAGAKMVEPVLLGPICPDRTELTARDVRVSGLVLVLARRCLTERRIRDTPTNSVDSRVSERMSK